MDMSSRIETFSKENGLVQFFLTSQFIKFLSSLVKNYNKIKKSLSINLLTISRHSQFRFVYPLALFIYFYLCFHFYVL